MTAAMKVGGSLLAEVDGNRTRLRWIAPYTRFEGGGAHQALRHLHQGIYRLWAVVGSLSDHCTVRARDRGAIVWVTADG